MNQEYLTKKKHFTKRFESLKATRQSFESNWKEINKYLGIGTGMFDLQSQNNRFRDPEYEKNINTLPIRYAQNLAASLVATLTPSNMRWFGYSVKDETREEQIYLRHCSEVILNMLNQSGLNAFLNRSFLEAALYGVNPLGLDWNAKERKFSFFPLTIGQFWIDRDENMEVNTLYHVFNMPLHKIVARFGEDVLTEKMKLDLIQDNVDTEYTILHAIEPNPRYLPSFDNGYNKRFISAYMLLDEKVDGFLEWKTTSKFPWNVSSWDIDPTTPYCPGIGYYALGDVKSLQSYEEDLAIASAKLINPPLKGSTTMKSKEKDISAGGVTYTDDPAAFTELFQVKYDINAAIVNIQRIAQRLYELFYNNVFYALLAKDKTMSATEAAGITTEKMTLLGAVVERIQSTLLGPLVENAFLIAMENNALDDEEYKMPESLKGKLLEVTYHSLMAQTQSLTDLRLFDDYLQRVSILSSINPKAARKPDVLAIADYYAKKYDIDLSLIKPNEVIEQEDAMAARAQSQAQQVQENNMNAESLKAMAGAAKDFATAQEKAPEVLEVLGSV